ncbi:MAG TPA: hypothetical protein VIV15_16470, partial [Anaerolineales bacterium]
LGAQTSHSDPTDLSYYVDRGAYAFDPETILTLLDVGGAKVFKPIPTTAGPSASPLPPGSLHWTQLDYLKITNAVSQLVWKEGLADWTFYYVSFDALCQDNPVGFDRAEITFYKRIQGGWDNVYSARHVERFPLSSEVDWGGAMEFHRSLLDGWNGVDLTAFKVDADEALTTAERRQGGSYESPQ